MTMRVMARFLQGVKDFLMNGLDSFPGFCAARLLALSPLAKLSQQIATTILAFNPDLLRGQELQEHMEQSARCRNASRSGFNLDQSCRIRSFHNCFFAYRPLLHLSFWRWPVQRRANLRKCACFSAHPIRRVIHVQITPRSPNDSSTRACRRSPSGGCMCLFGAVFAGRCE